MTNPIGLIPESEVVLDPVLPPFCDGSSPHNGCPQIFRTNRDTFVVQGYALSPAVAGKITFAGDESGVEIPEALLIAVANKLGGSL